jgi:poly(3-hydroxybutyrate) depolymerase
MTPKARFRRLASSGRALLGAALLLGLPACSSESPAAPDAGADADASPALEGGAGDGAAAPTAPKSTPKEVTVSEWMVGWIPSSFTSDPVEAAIEAGTFTYPAAGKDANKITWSAKTPGASGAIASFPSGTSYAVAKVKVASPARLFLRSEYTTEVWVNGAPRPGDTYGSTRIRVPLPAKAGENLVVLQISGGRGETQAQLFTSPDELYVNDKDLTVPDPLVGDSAEQCLGVPVLNLTDQPVYDLAARVVSGDAFVATSVTLPALAPRSMTQAAFKLKPRAAFTAAQTSITVKLRLESASLSYSYEREVTLTTAPANTAYRRTRVSKVDGSCQFYGVVPPSSLDKSKEYALVLSLHGAGVDALGQAKSYSQKDWAYIVAPTNRRPFGFDWEVWGRLDALEALDHAKSTFAIDETRVYLTGHSMGGHGTWNVGVLHPGRFAALAPSGGWCSFYTYAGMSKPKGAFARSEAASDTLAYLTNLARRGVYILHGGDDETVPVSEAQNMYAAMEEVTGDVVYHEEAGAGHWWDGSAASGVDCVDWPDLFSFLKAHTLDAEEIDFVFTTPAPWVSSVHSYVTILSQSDPYKDSTVRSRALRGALTLTTENVRGMSLDGAVLARKGITSLEVDGKAVALSSAAIAIGEQSGKRPGVHGPWNEVMYRPFCVVYEDGDDRALQYAAYLVSSWSVLGNGQACSMPLSRFRKKEPSGLNPIFVGVASSEIDNATLPVSWSSTAITLGGKSYSDALVAFAFPRGGRLAAALVATSSAAPLMPRILPLYSTLVLPDYLVYSASGTKVSGFFDASWAYDSTLER